MQCVTCQGIGKEENGDACWDCQGTGYNLPSTVSYPEAEQERDAIREDYYDDIRKGIE